MAIPGLTPKYDPVAKVRVGIKVQKNGREYPQSVDYFVCDEAGFQNLYPGKPRCLEIMLPYEEPTENFNSGLEQWAGQMLVCYAKGEVTPNKTPIAWRRKTLKRGGGDVNLLDGFKVLSDKTIGQDRACVACLSRECPVFKAKDCKPMGRLQFYFAKTGPEGGIYQLDTKSWNAIEQIDGVLSRFKDTRGITFKLKVEMITKGTSRYPLVSLHAPEPLAAPVVGSNQAAAGAATSEVNACVDHTRTVPLSLEAFRRQAQLPESAVREALVYYLDQTRPGWRTDGTPERIKEIGVREAAIAIAVKNP